MPRLSKILDRMVSKPKRTLSSTDTRCWTFDNGIKCYRKYFLDLHLEKYAVVNVHEPEEEAIFCAILEKYDGKGIFLDVGAAWGYYSFLARKLCPDIEIHAINPDDYFVGAMRDNMTLNDVHDVHIHPVAISDSVGKCRIVSGSYGDRIKRGGGSTRRRSMISSAASIERCT